MAALVAVAVAAVPLTVLLFLRHISMLERAWSAERGELLTRIQRPELIPAAQPATFDVPEPEPDEIDLVGVIADAPKEED